MPFGIGIIGAGFIADTHAGNHTLADDRAIAVAFMTSSRPRFSLKTTRYPMPSAIITGSSRVSMFTRSWWPSPTIYMPKSSSPRPRQANTFFVRSRCA